jgi:hypothetical protein
LLIWYGLLSEFGCFFDYMSPLFLATKNIRR